MSKLRGCGTFDELWERRLSLQDDGGMVYEILGIEDLVAAKKTQRDKDWPMIRRLVDAHYEQFREQSQPAQVQFWLRESRTPVTLVELAHEFPVQLDQVLPERPLLKAARAGQEEILDSMLAAEVAEIRRIDRAYWEPLTAELHELRETKRNTNL